MRTGVLAARVYRGIALMDETHGPGWVWKVDPSTLDMCSTCRCVVGQTYGDEYARVDHGLESPYAYGVESMGLQITYAAPVEVGFALDPPEDDRKYRPLTRIWAYAITRLREQRPEVSHA